MTHVRRFLRRLAALFRSTQAESELAREITAHLQLLEDQFVAKGMSRDEARYAARRSFGGVEQAKEEQRDARAFRWLAGWPMDLKLGARMLVKSPGLTVIAVIALAVAIGAGAAYYEFVNDYIRPTLTFAGGDRLVGIVTVDAAKNSIEPRVASDYRLWRDQLRSITDLGANRPRTKNLSASDGRVAPVRMAEMTAAAFRVIPTPPALGRPIAEDDERPGAPPVVVLGHDVWRARFDGNPAVVGTTVRMDDVPHTVVGVMPEGFGFPSSYGLWTPLTLASAGTTRGEGPAIRVFGRLAPGASLESAQAELDAIARSPEFGASSRSAEAGGLPPMRALVMPYVESLRDSPGFDPEIAAFYAVNVLLVGLLGICGVNVATLVFARTASRAGEITVRTALGASRGRIVAQLFAEALVLCAAGAGVGLAGAAIGLARLSDIWPATIGQQLPFWWDPRLSTDTLLYTTLLAVIAAMIVGIVPALKATDVRMQGRLKEAGSGGSTMQFGKLWTGVIVSQVALTMVFLLTVVSIAWNVVTLRRDVAAVAVAGHEYLTAHVVMNEGAEANVASFHRALEEMRRRLAAHPAVEHIGYVTRLPGLEQGVFQIEPPSASGDPLSVRSANVDAGYFETFDQPIVAGRAFTQGDIEAGRRVAVVDESFVRLVLGGGRAVGHMVRQPPSGKGRAPGPWFEIVGVVKDMSTKAHKTAENAMLYRPLDPGGDGPIYVVVRARSDAATLGVPLTQAATAADSRLRLYNVMTLDRVVEEEATILALLGRAIGTVGAIALLLSTAGIYALVAFTLSRRTREIGVRIALGASPPRIVTGMLAKVFMQVGLGVLLGAIPGAAIIIAFAGGAGGVSALAIRIGVSLLVGVLFLAVAAISCAVPLRRALRIQPTQALRAE